MQLNVINIYPCSSSSKKKCFSLTLELLLLTEKQANLDPSKIAITVYSGSETVSSNLRRLWYANYHTHNTLRICCGKSKFMVNCHSTATWTCSTDLRGSTNNDIPPYPSCPALETTSHAADSAAATYFEQASYVVVPPEELLDIPTILSVLVSGISLVMSFEIRQCRPISCNLHVS